MKKKSRPEEQVAQKRQATNEKHALVNVREDIHVPDITSTSTEQATKYTPAHL